MGSNTHVSAASFPETVPNLVLDFQLAKYINPLRLKHKPLSTE
jgi:hypothetical protein